MNGSRLGMDEKLFFVRPLPFVSSLLKNPVAGERRGRIPQGRGGVREGRGLVVACIPMLPDLIRPSTLETEDALKMVRSQVASVSISKLS